jgi:pimeloyl-ACP methyl ester carboxylesterase
MPIAQAAGARIHYEEVGRGTTIVFAHEFGADLREWEAQLRFFSRGHRCIRYNARGYPPSEVPEDPAQYGWEQARDDLLAVMDAAGVERAHVVGLSMGGYAALAFALAYPQRCLSIVPSAAGSGSILDAAQLEVWRQDCRMTGQRMIDAGMDGPSLDIGHGPTRIQLKHKDPRGWQDFVDHLREHSGPGSGLTMQRYQGGRPTVYAFEEGLRRCEVPALLIVGDEDVPCLAPNLFLKRTMPRAQLAVVPATGHAVNLEEPATYNALVARFIAQVEGGRLPPPAPVHP